MTRCPLCEQEIENRVKRFIYLVVGVVLFLVTAFVVVQFIVIPAGNELLEYWAQIHPPKYIKCR